MNPSNGSITVRKGNLRKLKTLVLQYNSTEKFISMAQLEGCGKWIKLNGFLAEKSCFHPYIVLFLIILTLII